MTWWLAPVAVTDEGLRLERAHGEWVWPQTHGRLGASLRRIGDGGRYELIGLLNRGGQAYLWAARDHQAHDALVVVKTVHPRIDDAVAGARLTREARLLELLAGEPTVMQVLDWGPGRMRGADQGEFETEQPWLVLPYRPHISLDRALVLAGGRLTGDAAWQIGHDLGTALQHLHSNNVVHRDLSVRNLLLTPTGCVLADLGMAWAASMVDQVVEQQFTTGITHQQNLGVTWGWLAPEAARPPLDGHRPDREPAADVFGWGLHMFCALTGRHPWAAQGLRPSEDELYAMYDVGARPSLEGLSQSDAPESIQRLVIDALGEKPADRPSARELISELGPRVPSLAATQIQLSTLRRQLDASRRAQKTAKPSHSAEDKPAPPVRSAAGWWTSPGRRERAAAALLTVVIALVAGTFGVITAAGQRNDATHAQAAAQGFPAAVDLAVSIQREAANWAPDHKAERTAARAHTDAALRTLTADVSRLPAAARGPSQAKLQELAALSTARQLVDALNKRALPEQYGASLGADQVDGAYVSIQNDARSISAQLTDLMQSRATDSAALARVDAASASTQSAFATADLSRIDLRLISGSRTLNVDTTAARAQAAAQAEVHLDQAGALVTDQAGTRALAAVHATDDQLRKSSANLLAQAQNPEVATTDPDTYAKLMTGRIDRMQAAADVEIQAFSDQEASASHRALNEIIACIGLTLVVVLAATLGTVRPRGGRGPATGQVARPVPAGPSPDLSPNDLFTPANRRLPFGASDV